MYDAIIVGARVAGAPTAMLLARCGYRVLLLDKAPFPSDIMSTHFIHVPGVARLSKWGLLDNVAASNCPPIESVDFRLNGVSFAPPGAPERPFPAYCPRRKVLDPILVDAAVESGVEFRDRFSVKRLLFDGDVVAGIEGAQQGGADVREEARVVIGADGMHSLVAKSVHAPEYNTKPSMSFGYYNYWSSVENAIAEIHFTDEGGALAFPTNDNLVCVAVGGPTEMFQEFRKDIPANYWKIIEHIPQLHEKMLNAKAEERYIGTNDQANFFRKPYGPGWALVGDAGYHRDFVTGLGITDAFRDAELLSGALDDGFSGRRPLEESLADYESTRNNIAEPLYELTTQLVSGDPPTIEQFIAFGMAMERMMPAEGAPVA
jgi:flavin-dependent dehydrogenase